MTILDFVLRLGLAILLGCCIGVERQWRQKSAGLRTNTLVSLGAASFILLSVAISQNSETGDPGRIAAQIVSGIGFLGAGVIMKNGMNIQGLNTAATLWCSAAVGSLAGMGLYKEAVATTGFIMLVHLTLRPISTQLGRISSFNKGEIVEMEYLIDITCKELVENQIRVLLLQEFNLDNKILLRSLSSNDDKKNAEVQILAEVLTLGEQDYTMEKIVSKLTIEKNVTKASWEIISQKSDL